MELNDLYNEYMKLKAKAGEDPRIDLKAEKLLNQLAEKARDLCMRVIYWKKDDSFRNDVPEEEAHSIFNEVFTKQFHMNLSINPGSLFNRLFTYFNWRLLDCRRDARRIPVPVSEKVKDKSVSPDALLEYFIEETRGHEWTHPDTSIQVKEILRGLFDDYYTLTEIQRKVKILEALDFSNDEIAHFLKCKKEKVTKAKNKAKEKLKKTLREEKE